LRGRDDVAVCKFPCVRDGSRMAESFDSVHDSPAPQADAKSRSTPSDARSATQRLVPIVSAGILNRHDPSHVE
jgi:hypothetical protein